MFSMFSAKTSDVFTFYVAWGHEKATLNRIWPSRLKRISRNAIWIGFQTTYECSSKWICTNRISCSSLPFRLSKYDRISIGFAQKSDLGWQSERGIKAFPHWARKSETNFRRDDVMTCWNKTTASYGCFHIDREHSRTENANVFFSSSPTNLLSFAKRKHGPSNKIWALHHMTRATAVTQKVDAVALKAQKTVLSTSIKTPK